MSELSERIQNVISNEPVAVFIKGTPQIPMCGNSHRALTALREAGAPVTAVDILPDPAIRQELQAISGWPTIPQVFVKGELIGGADITQELGESGELARILEAKLGSDYRNDAEEHVVDVVSGVRAYGSGPAVADRGNRARADQRALERLTARAAEPAVQVRHPLEHTLVVALAQRREQRLVRMQIGMTRRPLAEIRWPGRVGARRCEHSMLALVPVARVGVEAGPRELVDEEQRREARELRDPVVERVDVVEDAAGHDGVEGTVDVLEADLPERRPVRRVRIDAEHVVARGGERGDEAAVAAAAHLQHSPWRRRQLV